MIGSNWMYCVLSPHPEREGSTQMVYNDGSTDAIEQSIDGTVLWFLESNPKANQFKIVRNLDGTTTLFFPRN